MNKSIDGLKFIDWVMRDVYKVRTLAALSYILEIDAAHLGKIRNNIMHTPARILVRVHEDSGIPTKEIRRIVA